MAAEVADVELAVLALGPEESAAVIRASPLSTESGIADNAQDQIDDTWRGEIGNRLDDVLHGKVELESFEEPRDKFARTYPTSSI